MKYLAVLAVFALVGCKQAQPPTQVTIDHAQIQWETQSSIEPGHVLPPKPLTKNEYIAKNRCEVANVTGGFQYYSDDGTTKTANITVTYICPNGVYVALDGGN